MNDQDQEAAEPRHPLILTVPAYNFVVALHPDCLGWSNGGALSAKNLAKEVEPVDSVQSMPPELDSATPPSHSRWSPPELSGAPGPAKATSFLTDTRRPITSLPSNLSGMQD